MRRWCSASVVVVILALSAGASGQAVDRPETREARVHFDAGERFYENAQYAQSLIEFRRVFEILDAIGHRNAAVVLYNVARCYAQLGRDREAIATYDQFLRDAPDDAPFIDHARSELRELRARVSLETSTAEVARGGGISPVGPMVAAAGAALALAGVVTGAIALADHSAATAQCTGMLCPAEAAGPLDAAHTVAVAADVLLFGGLGVAVVGVVLLAVLPADGPAPDSPRASLECSDRGCVASIAGAF